MSTMDSVKAFQDAILAVKESDTYKRHVKMALELTDYAHYNHGALATCKEIFYSHDAYMIIVSWRVDQCDTMTEDTVAVGLHYNVPSVADQIRLRSLMISNLIGDIVVDLECVTKEQLHKVCDETISKYGKYTLNYTKHMPLEFKSNAWCKDEWYVSDKGTEGAKYEHYNNMSIAFNQLLGLVQDECPQIKAVHLRLLPPHEAWLFHCDGWGIVVFPYYYQATTYNSISVRGITLTAMEAYNLKKFDIVPAHITGQVQPIAIGLPVLNTDLSPVAKYIVKQYDACQKDRG